MSREGHELEITVTIRRYYLDEAKSYIVVYSKRLSNRVGLNNCRESGMSSPS